MKIVEKTYKCAVCGEENEYYVGMSNYISGYSDFDLKPVGSLGGIHSGILECPSCHYANYDIEKSIESRFENNVGLWHINEKIQSIIDNYSGELRKVLLVATQYCDNMQYDKAYNLYIMASWLTDKKKDIEIFKSNANSLFLKYALPKYCQNILQMADVLRTTKNFDVSEYLLNATENLIKVIGDDDPNEIIKPIDIINEEKLFITKKDSKTHNLEEIVKKKNQKKNKFLDSFKL